MANLLIILTLFGIGWSTLFAFAEDRLRQKIGSRFVLSFVAITCAGFYTPGVPAFFALIVAVFILTARSREAALSQYILLAGLIVQIP